jgi:hypothetical protein
LALLKDPGADHEVTEIEIGTGRGRGIDTPTNTSPVPARGWAIAGRMKMVIRRTMIRRTRRVGGGGESVRGTENTIASCETASETEIGIATVTDATGTQTATESARGKGSETVEVAKRATAVASEIARTRACRLAAGRIRVVVAARTCKDLTSRAGPAAMPI